MIRASWSYLTWLGIFGLLSGIESFSSRIPVCESKGPSDIYVDLSNVGLQVISKPLVADPPITCLNLGNNGILKIAPEVFNELPTLRYLDFSGNSAESYDNLKYTSLPNLQSLVLGEARYSTRIQQSWEYTQYSNERKGTDIVFSLPKLEKLSLSYIPNGDWLHNFIAALDAPNLTHLYLCENHLGNDFNIPLTPHVSHLYLDGNTMVGLANLYSYEKLRHLSMNGNNITILCGLYCNSFALTLRGMYNLEYLSLASNRIEDIRGDAFENLINLRVLNLSQNKIRHLPKHMFDNTTQLKNLTLDKNKLTQVPAICALKELEVLLLNGNEISSFDQSDFCDLPKLFIIQLRSNGLTTIADNTFDNLPAFAILDLSWNSIGNLSKNWIPENSTLIELHLDGNSFTDVSSMSLEHAKNLNLLSFGHNPLETISIGSLMGLPLELRIDVSRSSEAL